MEMYVSRLGTWGSVKLEGVLDALRGGEGEVIYKHAVFVKWEEETMKCVRLTQTRGVCNECDVVMIDKIIKLFGDSKSAFIFIKSK